MVTDTRSDGPWQALDYDGYDPLPIGDLKVILFGNDGFSVADRLFAVFIPK